MIIQDRSWVRQAACKTAGPLLFIDSTGESKKARTAREGRAKAICARCPVRAQCLDYALGPPGQPQPVSGSIWGGMNDSERSAEKRNRGRRVTGRAA
jgi:WhiB family transcriptional regulator, redox-sensing transcriptional regulator